MLVDLQVNALWKDGHLSYLFAENIPNPSFKPDIEQALTTILHTFFELLHIFVSLFSLVLCVELAGLIVI